MSVRTKSPRFTEAVAAAEASALPGILTAETTLRSLHQSISGIEQEVDLAEDELADAEASWARLDDGPTLAEHAELTSAVRRAQLRAQGAASALSRAQRSAASTDVTLAQALVPVIALALPGVPVIPSFVKVVATPSAAEVPVVVVTQSKPSRVLVSGDVAGEVTLTYWRSDIHRPIDVRSLETAAARAGAVVEVQGFPSEPDENVEVVRLTVSSVAVATPILPVIEEHAPFSLSQSVAVAFIDGASLSGQAITDRFESQSWSTSRLVVRALPVVTSESVDAEGTRTLTVEGSFVSEILSYDSGTDAMVEEAREALEARFTDRPMPGLGRVVEFSLINTRDSELSLDDDDRRGAIDVARIRPRDSASVGYEMVGQTVWRATVISSMSATDAQAA